MVHNNLPLTIVVQFQGSIPAPRKVVVQVESRAVALSALPALLGKQRQAAALSALPAQLEKQQQALAHSQLVPAV